ncbi:unnamed protein product [Pleuronectes platessa]|uniref:Uncharacterized protein n=1 Tax=Pleuronectes platessa TaxID=8262 RepID=A0A9N7Z3X9_PLEPL|nr:unnamed protein product [Pleuronectes platessa]
MEFGQQLQHLRAWQLLCTASLLLSVFSIRLGCLDFGYCPQRATVAAVSPSAVPTHSQAVSLPVALRRSPAVRDERRPTLRVLQTANESRMRKATADPALAYREGWRPFHRRGTAEQKARSPMVRSLVLGTQRSELLVDLRVRVEVWGVMSSCRNRRRGPPCERRLPPAGGVAEVIRETGPTRVPSRCGRPPYPVPSNGPPSAPPTDTAPRPKRRKAPAQATP